MLSSLHLQSISINSVFEWIFLCFWSYQGMVKGYSGVFRLGEATSTWDADSPVCILASLWWSAEHSSIKGLQMDRTYWMEFQEAIPNTNLLDLHLIMLLFDVAEKLYWNILLWKEVHHLISMYIINISFSWWLNNNNNNNNNIAFFPKQAGDLTSARICWSYLCRCQKLLTLFLYVSSW